MSRPANIINYQGHIDVEQMDHLLMALQSKLEMQHLDLLTRKRIYSACVECLDNITKHAVDNNGAGGGDQGYPPDFRVGTDDKGYVVTASNLLQSHQASYIKERVEHLNQLNQSQVDQVFREAIRKGATSPNHYGGGLGLIVLAKTTPDPIEYEIKPVSRDYSYFTIGLRITRARASTG